MITYTSNLNTAEVIRRQLRQINPHSPSTQPSQAQSSTRPKHLRILLETDAPFMVPGNIYKDITITKGSKDASAKGNDKGGGGGKAKFFMSHTKMIPWTAEFVASIAEECVEELGKGVEGGVDAATDTAGVDENDDWHGDWTVEKIMRISRRNANAVYGI